MHVILRKQRHLIQRHSQSCKLTGQRITRNPEIQIPKRQSTLTSRKCREQVSKMAHMMSTSRMTKQSRTRIVRTWRTRPVPSTLLLTSCAMRRLVLSGLPGAPTFIVHECALDPARLQEEGATDSDVFLDTLDMRPLVADELPEDIYHTLTRIVGLSMLDKVSVVPGSIGDQWMQDSAQDEQSADTRDQSEFEKAQIESELAGSEYAHSSPEMSPQPAHRNTKQTYSRRARRSDPHGDVADYVPPEERADPEPADVGDVSIEELERLDESEHKRKSDDQQDGRRMRLRSARERRPRQIYSP